jgi:hypothetical protein
MSKHLDKSRAVSITRLAQGGFVLLACGAAATAYLGLPMAQPPTVKDFTVLSTEPVEVPKVAQVIPVDFAGSASRLGRLANAPRPVQSAAPVDSTPTSDEPKTPAGLSDIKYLGFANVGEMRLALLNVNARQRFVREGQVLDSERVQQIGPDFVLLTHEGGERRISLQERSGERITRLRGGPAVPADPQKAGTARINGMQPPRTLGGEGVKGLSSLPEEFHKWPPAYQRRFSRVVNDLAQQANFPDDATLIEKAKASLEADGFKPEDKDAMEKLQAQDKEDAAKDGKYDPNQKKPEK